MSNTIDFTPIMENWKAPFISREEAERASGGLVTAKYLANLDSLGRGPSGRIKCGRKVAYPVRSFVEWLTARARPAKGTHDNHGL